MADAFTIKVGDRFDSIDLANERIARYQVINIHANGTVEAKIVSPHPELHKTRTFPGFGAMVPADCPDDCGCAELMKPWVCQRQQQRTEGE